jgi:hypothetical protein
MSFWAWLKQEAAPGVVTLTLLAALVVCVLIFAWSTFKRRGGASVGIGNSACPVTAFIFTAIVYSVIDEEVDRIAAAVNLLSRRAS